MVEEPIVVVRVLLSEVTVETRGTVVMGGRPAPEAKTPMAARDADWFWACWEGKCQILVSGDFFLQVLDE